MVKESGVDLAPGFYIDPARNGYGVIGVAENPETGMHVVVYRTITQQGKDIGRLQFLPVGEFTSLIIPNKGFKHFTRLPRTLGLSPKPGSRIDKKV